MERGQLSYMDQIEYIGVTARIRQEKKQLEIEISELKKEIERLRQILKDQEDQHKNASIE